MFPNTMVTQQTVGDQRLAIIKIAIYLKMCWWVLKNKLKYYLIVVHENATFVEIVHTNYNGIGNTTMIIDELKSVTNNDDL